MGWVNGREGGRVQATAQEREAGGQAQEKWGEKVVRERGKTRREV